jgi:signal transduction histidine kinase
MSAAPVVLVDSTAFVSGTPVFDHAETIRNLAHELRQPLSAIEAIAYYLEMTLPPEQIQTRQYLVRLQSLVEQANLTLIEAIGRVRDLDRI